MKLIRIFLFNEVEKYFIDTSGNLKMKESARGRVFLDMVTMTLVLQGISQLSG